MARISHKRHRFPATVIHHAMWLYLRFTLSIRDVEEMLAVTPPVSAQRARQEKTISYQRHSLPAWRCVYPPNSDHRSEASAFNAA